MYLRIDELLDLAAQNVIKWLVGSDQTSSTIIGSEFNEEIEILKWDDTKNDRW